MRFLGNKASIVTEIDKLLVECGLVNNTLKFFDAFCGTGSVADYFKDKYDIIVNDIMKWSTLYTQGRVYAQACTFEKLGFNPFDFLNSNNLIRHDFIYNNYAPTNSSRMYFTPENAERIDYFRWQIEEWKTLDLITTQEYCYLIACLIESVSDVSNTAGVYGAYLKKWDTRAQKRIIFNKVDSLEKNYKSMQAFNDKIENIIGEIDCDILYLDPPYTQNQYGTQYHLLETLILNDNPTISKITGSRSTAPLRSDWSKEFKVNILFDEILAKTKAKYIILSYNNDGFMSKEFIEASMKRYGNPDTFICKKISYKKYQNWKSNNDKTHYEYLFFIEKKEQKDINFESPLNYIGSKAKIVSKIKSYLPPNIDGFYDVFGGGFNVGINVEANFIVYNDINYFVSNLINIFKKYDTYDNLLYVKRMIKKFGLKKADNEAYLKARAFYNSLPIEKRDPRLLLSIIMYGFQQQIRFNGSHEFNNPVGVRWFNDKVLEKFVSFSRVIKKKNIEFKSEDYRKVEKNINKTDFVYLDPPYKLTTGSYNDGKRGFNGWNEKLETELFSFLDELNAKGIRFMLSYVITHRGKINLNLLEWINKNNYKKIELGDIIGISGSKRQEVLIVNYE